MTRSSVVFLGGGRITAAIVEALHRARFSAAITVHDRHQEKLKKLRRGFGVRIESDLLRAVLEAGILVIAVRPGSVIDLLRSIRRGCQHPSATASRRPHIAISLAAGIPLRRLRAELGPPVHWARAMPSPACSSGRGLTAIAFDRGFPRNAKVRVKRLFASLGPVLEIPERQFDAFTAVYSVSHGYHALAALTSAAVKSGLDRGVAEVAAAHALADGICSWREKGVHLAELLREAATPGGIAAAVMASADRAGYRRIIERAVRAGVERAKGQTRAAARSNL